MLASAALRPCPDKYANVGGPQQLELSPAGRTIKLEVGRGGPMNNATFNSTDAACECPKCGYDARGLSGNTNCPECGSIYNPHARHWRNVRFVDPRLSPTFNRMLLPLGSLIILGGILIVETSAFTRALSSEGIAGLIVFVIFFVVMFFAIRAESNTITILKNGISSTSPKQMWLWNEIEKIDAHDRYGYAIIHWKPEKVTGWRKWAYQFGMKPYCGITGFKGTEQRDQFIEQANATLKASHSRDGDG